MGDFTIQISSKLVSRLVEDAEKSKKKTKRTKAKGPLESPWPQNKASLAQISDDSGTPKGTAAPGWPIMQPPLFLPVTPLVQSANAELEAIRSVLEESEKVVESLHKQEEKMLHEVTQSAKDLRDKEFKLPYQKPMPCISEIDACLACYKDNGKDPLKCAHLVNKFADCARRFRQNVSLGEKGK
ncbi:Copper ion binding protein [Quillaja saponaria]|uniref:Copper ion binding protein n=1 Tax=Quillaja saponaria TaxID=32244 RepID=A0AAD7KRL1_QUISA|nr:Copper ion binding protein [Quillaja saponaria]